MGASLIPDADSAASAPDGSLRRGGQGLRRFRRTAHFPVPIRQNPPKRFDGCKAQPNAVDAQRKKDTIKRRRYGKEKTRRNPVGVGRRQSGFRQPLIACPLPAFFKASDIKRRKSPPARPYSGGYCREPATMTRFSAVQIYDSNAGVYFVPADDSAMVFPF